MCVYVQDGGGMCVCVRVCVCAGWWSVCMYVCMYVCRMVVSLSLFLSLSLSVCVCVCVCVCVKGGERECNLCRNLIGA